ncbi:unnamed protein product [Paramecium sonneborni]|uniref:Uncharacterized protein n=1 Tax=Paramecium sonneborni TaxID=65129 RepID=A0A8S1P077_9CILI|nr:unnamed protein product [Paramecium sonneborni]
MPLNELPSSSNKIPKPPTDLINLSRLFFFIIQVFRKIQFNPFIMINQRCFIFIKQFILQHYFKNRWR